MKVFIDTSAFVALFVEKELLHEKVAKKYYDYRQERAVFFTSNFILDELYTRLLFYREIDVGKYIQKLKNSADLNELAILQIHETLFEKSAGVFLKFSEHKISFTDATTYVLYKDLRLDEIFTLDRDFKRMRARTSF